MIKRKCLAIALSTTIAISPISHVPAQTSADPTIELILKAMTAKNPNEAKALIMQARKRLANERIPEDRLRKIEELLEQALARVQASSGGRQFSTSSGSPSGIGRWGQRSNPNPNPNPNPPPNVEDEFSLLNRNPDLRTSMHEIGRGRLARDANELPRIIRDRTGREIRDYDESERTSRQQMSEAGEFVSALKKAGLIAKSFAAENQALREKYDTAPIEVLADHIINNKVLYSASVGALRQVLASMRDLPFGRSGEFAGVTIEALGTFVTNANLILRLADLYNLQLSEYDEEVAIYAVFALSKMGAYYGLSGGLSGGSRGSQANGRTASRITQLISSFGKTLGAKFSEARMSADPSARSRLMNFIVRNPMLSRVAAPQASTSVAGTNSTSSASGSSAQNPQSISESDRPQTQPGASTSAHAQNHDPNQAQNQEPSRGQTHDQSTKQETSNIQQQQHQQRQNQSRNQADGDNSQNSQSRRRSVRAASLSSQLIQVSVSAGFSAAETAAIGWAAKIIFDSARARERQLANESFRRYLMGPNGEGLTKLLILSMYNGQLPELVALRDNKDPRVQFIVNLARSARMCTSEDALRWLRAQDPASPKADAELRQIEILRAACDSNLSSARSVRMVKEFATFNEIPQEFVANLRLAGRENRLRMGELLLQLQFLDGDRDPEERKHFNEVVGKILGFESLEDQKYFERMEAFIRERGGMEEDVYSPTGYTIADKSAPNPYNLKSGYTAHGVPDAPRAESSQNSSRLDEESPRQR